MAVAAAITIGAIALIDSDEATVSTPTPAVQTEPGIRYDGGPEEGTRGIIVVPPPTTRYDGGPEEGTRGVTVVPDTRYDGGPEEGTRGAGQ